MPYPSYTYMTDADALAIKAYLFSLPPVHAANRADTLSFPFNQRWAMGPWSLFFNENVRFQPNTARSREWNRGVYLAEALAHCGDCHTPRNLAFALDNRSKFAGAVAAGWHAFNITSDRGTAWSLERQRDRGLSRDRSRVGRGTAAGPMGDVVDQVSSLLTPARHQAWSPSAQHSADCVVGAGNNRAAGAGFAQAGRRNRGYDGQAHFCRRLRRLSWLDRRQRHLALCDRGRRPRRNNPARSPTSRRP